VALLQENRDTRDTGIVGKPQVQLQDIRTTMDKVVVEVRVRTILPIADNDLSQLSNLSLRSSFEYFLIGARNNADSFTTPISYVSRVGGDFIMQYLQYEPTILAKHFDAYATNHGRLTGMSHHPLLGVSRCLLVSPGIVNVLSSEAAKCDRKTSMKAVVMQMLRSQYRRYYVQYILFCLTTFQEGL
jgi:hypothetical protein